MFDVLEAPWRYKFIPYQEYRYWNWWNLGDIDWITPYTTRARDYKQIYFSLDHSFIVKFLKIDWASVW